MKKEIERNKENKLKTHNYCADREMQWELWFASTPVAIWASVFPNEFLYLLALTQNLSEHSLVIWKPMLT